MKHQHCRVVWIFLLQLLTFYSCFTLYLLHNNLQGKLPNTIIQWLYSAQARGEITFTLTYLLQLRLCFGELPYQLRIRFVPGSVPFEESEKHPYVQEMFFSHGNKQRILSWTSCFQECSALVESLICKHFSTFLIPSSLHWAEHLVCKNVQPWLRVSFASTSQPSFYLVPYTQVHVHFICDAIHHLILWCPLLLLP